jgi:hypothetical protein
MGLSCYCNCETSEDGIFNLGSDGHCEYGFEQANGEWVVLLLRNLTVQVYKPGPAWTKLAHVKLEGEPIDECPWPGPFTVGYMQVLAFVIRPCMFWIWNMSNMMALSA